MDEDELMEILNRHGVVLTCSNCGELLKNKMVGHKGDYFAGIIRFDPGCADTRMQPGDPATIYFICAECHSDDHEKWLP